MTGREAYTAAGFGAMKEKLARAAVNRAVHEMVVAKRNPNYFVGSPDEGYRYSYFEPGFEGYRLPPVDRSHAGLVPITVDYDGAFRPEPVQDVWAEIYEPWFTAVDEVFEGWDDLPDEREFHRLADSLRAARAPLQQFTRTFGEFDTTDLEILHAELGIAGDDPFDPYPSGAPRSAAVQVFRDHYVIPLQPAVLQQDWLADVLASQLDAEGRCWQRARRLVMEIGYLATTALAPESFDVAALIDVLGGVNTAIGLLPDPRVQLATKVTGLVLDGVELFLKAVQDRPPPGEAAIEELLSGATTRDVISRVRASLHELNRQITEEELAVYALCDRTLEATYQPSQVTPGGYRVAFNLPAPELLTETDGSAFDLPGGPGIDVDVRGIRRAASAMPRIAATLEVAAGNLEALTAGTSSWLRPGFIGFTGEGPYHAWSALRERLPWLLHDTAGELRAAGEHLELAMDYLERSDAASRDALAAHAREVGDVAAADPGPPTGPSRRGGPQP